MPTTARGRLMLLIFYAVVVGAAVVAQAQTGSSVLYAITIVGLMIGTRVSREVRSRRSKENKSGS